MVELIAKLRSLDPKLAIVLMTRDATEPLLIRAYDAGLDADVRLPASATYLHSRLRVLERQHGGPIAVAAKSAPAPVHGGLARFAISTAWHQASHNIVAAASKFLTLGVSQAEVTAVTTVPSHGKQIILASAEHQLELRAAIATDLQSARSLAMHLFGSNEDDLALDMLGELANIFMGTLKTSFSEEGLAITGGLPEDVAAELVLRPSVTYKHQESFALMIETARLVVHLGLRSRTNVMRQASALVEGMVLAKDLMNTRGVLLLSGGTRLSASMIEKVKGAVAPNSMVEVSP